MSRKVIDIDTYKIAMDFLMHISLYPNEDLIEISNRIDRELQKRKEKEND